jgi:hypothetical protein
MSATYTITNDTNGIFLSFFTNLTAFINLYYANGITQHLTAPGPSPGAPVQAVSLTPSGGAIVAGTAQPAPAQPTITVSSSGGTNNRFAITNDTNGLFNSYFLALTNFILANYAVSIISELSAPGSSPGAPVEAFSATKSYVQGTAFPAPSQPTIVIS